LTILDQVERGLKKFQFNIAAVASGRHQAIREYIESKPHVVLLGLDLPGDDWLETLKRIRKLNPSAQVLVLTDKPSRESVILAKKFGARDYILANTAADRLRETLRSACPIREARLATDKDVEEDIDKFVCDLDEKLFGDLSDTDSED